MIPVDGKEGPADVCVIESGGTIGDIESMPFIEAFGQFSYRVGPGNFCLVHVSLIPVLNVVDWVEASHLEDITAKEDSDIYRAAWNCLKGADGILVLGGFGDRGVQGKILAAKYARESKVPFLGICLGMQIVVIEYACLVLGLHDANSTEFDPKTSNPCVIFMLEGLKTHIGGTMRLGSRRTYFKVPDYKSAKLYGDATFVDERHRHKYEVNPDMISELEAAVPS
ncbi:hypothetical protein REPUB_Repub02eG0125200 [Reevesia pubescens]